MKYFLTTSILALIFVTQVLAQQSIYDVSAGNGNGIRFWSSDIYKIHMGNTSEYKYGPVTDYSIKMNMGGTSGRGWTWGQNGITPIAALSNIGDMQIEGSFASMANGIFYGNVGIGYNNPSLKLHVVHPNSSGVKIETDNSGENTAKLQVLYNFNSTSDERNAIIELGRDATESSSYKWRFRANSTHTWGNLPNLYIEYLRGGTYEKHMTFKNDGNIGIGDISPTEKLTVDGTILAEEVKVQNVPQSDYVFEPDYNLLPLTDVETFIKENKHLPEIPSAEDFKENGVGLGEMDDMLLRKVEELTLYFIQQNKELEELRTENEKLKTDNEEFKKIIEKEVEILKAKLK